DDQVRESVRVGGVDLVSKPRRVLVIWMPRFAGRLTGESRDPHAIVVDQPQLEGVRRSAGNEQDVPVLEVGMGNSCVAKRLAEPYPQPEDRPQVLRPAGVPADELVELKALHPLHFEGWVRVTANPDSFGNEVEPDGERQPSRSKMFVDRRVTAAEL